ncbi:MAG: 16S rRNA (cytosine(967)-C(5))-methyltransferase RsmB [Clostridia bacterium]|nr:16S rRNA (cytosine(967)-C(5))-methyltransferase RsmB [Clostridia bacterium]
MDKPALRISPREAALASLVGVYSRGKYSNIETDAVIKRAGFSDQDRKLYAALVFRTVEKTVTCDYIISLFSSRKIGDVEPAVLAALRLGVTQIMFMDGISDHAACNETVEALKKTPLRRASGFVNAVLRSVVRSKDDIKYPGKGDPRRLPVRYSVSESIVAILERDYGEKAEDILRALEGAPVTAVRVNTLKTNADRLSEITGGAPVPGAPGALILPSGSVPALTPGFEEGLFFVQDVSSQLCVAALGALPGMTVVDCCSAPGGKAFGAAADMKNDGRVICFDIHENKLSLIRKGAERLGISVIETRVCDGRTGDGLLDGTADRVICDVPCSGIGVISKKPEIRLKDLSSTGELSRTQLAILTRASRYLKPSGRLVYSTCTLNKAENENVVREFLRENGGFALSDETTVLPDADRDGFYFAVIEKTERKEGTQQQ